MAETKSKTGLLIVLTLVVIVLGGMAVAVAYKLRQAGTEPVAPTAPQSKPAAAEVTIDGCNASFSITPQACGGACTTTADCTAEAGETLECLDGVCVNPECPENITDCICPTPTPTPSPTPGPTATPTPGPSETPTPGPSATPTPGPSSTPTPGPSATPGPSGTPGPSATPTIRVITTPVPTVPQPEVPVAGITAPTVGVLVAGGALLLTGLALLIAF